MCFTVPSSWSIKLKSYVCVIAIHNTATKTERNRGKLSMGVSFFQCSLRKCRSRTCRGKKEEHWNDFDQRVVQFLLKLYLLDVLCWKKYLVHCSIESNIIEQRAHDTPYFNVPVSTCKYSIAHFLSFSTRLHNFPPESSKLILKNRYIQKESCPLYHALCNVYVHKVGGTKNTHNLLERMNNEINKDSNKKYWICAECPKSEIEGTIELPQPV